MNNQTLDVAVKILGSLGILAGGFGYLLSKIRGGTKEEKAENGEILKNNDQIKSFYKEQIDEYKEINAALLVKIDTQAAEFNLKLQDQAQKFNEQLQAIGTELGQMKGKYEAEKTQNEKLEKIFQNRDPETQKFMEYMIKSVENQTNVHNEIVRILGEIHAMAKDEHDRDFKVTSTITKEHTKE